MSEAIDPIEFMLKSRLDMLKSYEGFHPAIDLAEDFAREAAALRKLCGEARSWFVTDMSVAESQKMIERLERAANGEEVTEWLQG